MYLFNRINNIFNAVIGRNQALEQLIEAKDIERALASFTNKREEADKALQEYNVDYHPVMSREDKILKNAKGERTGVQTRWKLPVPYPEYINEIALVFLYGQPVKWTDKGEDTQTAFGAYQDFLESTHFSSKLRECKRLAGKETQSAMLFRVYRDKDGKSDCQIRVLANSKGDELYARWDIYENLTSFAWGYYTKDNESQTSYHVDFFLPDVNYRCTRGKNGWEVVKEKNPIGKIPIILFEQDVEWNGVQYLINREETIGSRTADTNDYFSDPLFFISADLVNKMPGKEDENKTFMFKGSVEGARDKAFFLTWDSASESKQQEINWLQKHILSKSFTPNIDFEQMKGLSNVSGKALKQMMLLADIKASRHKEKHDEYLTRASSLILSIIGNVLDVSLKSECDNCKISHEFQDPFGEDIAGMLDNLIKSKDADILSAETAISLNPYVKDKDYEIDKIKTQTAESAQLQRDLFGTNQTHDDIYGGAE